MPATIANPTSGTAGKNSVAGTTLLVPYPAGVQLGYLLELDVSNSSATRPDNADALVAAGWVARGDVNSGGSSPSLRRWTKIATSTEVTHSTNGDSLSVTTPNSTSQGRMRHFGGNVDPVTTLDALCDSTHGTYSSSTSTSPFAIQGTTTSLVNTMASLVAAGNSTSGTWTPPTALGGTWNETWDDATTTPKITHDYWLWSSSGSTGTVNVSPSAGVRGCAILTFYRPAPTLFALTGEVDATSASSGSTGLAAGLTGSVAGTTTASGAPGLAAALAGDVDGATATSGSIGARFSLAGEVDATTGLAGSLGAILGLAGTAAGTSETSGALTMRAGLAGVAAATSDASGSPNAVLGLTGILAALSDVSGDFIVFHPRDITLIGRAVRPQLSGGIIPPVLSGGSVKPRLTGRQEP